MCLNLYAASSVTLPLRAEPEISVEEIGKVYGAVRRWFSLPEVRRIGAHTGCSCGFPSVAGDEPIDWYDGIFDDHDDRAEDLASVRALFSLIDEALSQSDAMRFVRRWIVFARPMLRVRSRCARTSACSTARS